MVVEERSGLIPPEAFRRIDLGEKLGRLAELVDGLLKEFSQARLLQRLGKSGQPFFIFLLKRLDFRERRFETLGT